MDKSQKERGEQSGEKHHGILVYIYKEMTCKERGETKKKKIGKTSNPFLRFSSGLVWCGEVGCVSFFKTKERALFISIKDSHCQTYD